MKKLAVLFLSLALLFGLTACGTAENSGETVSNSNVSAESEAATDSANGKVLVVYYSASGNTERVAKDIAQATNGDLFELVPKEPYTDEDLDWTTDGSRVNLEHEDESLRTIPLEKSTVENWDDYDTVFIGYPIWWGIAAWPVNEFVTGNNFSEKTVIPFCTSASSELGESGKLLEEMAGTGDWQEGQRFSSSINTKDISNWLDGLGL